MGDGQNQLKEGEFWYWHDERTGDGEPDFRSSAHNSEKLIACRQLNFFIGKNNSGKSQFLRRLFVGDPPKDFNSALPDDLDEQIHGILRAQIRSPRLRQSIIFDGWNATGRTVENINEIGEFYQHVKDKVALLASPETNRHRYKNKLDALSRLLQSYNITISDLGRTYSFSPFKHTEQFIQDLLTLEEMVNKNIKIDGVFYIPTLRGLRPTQTNEPTSKTPYADRTIKDYFDPTKQKAENVITGENLYIELTQALLGEPKQRESVREYEKALSQYFFDGATISLIPKYGEDTVSIKIGDDDQRSVTQLGDGLQQVLILTYEAFLKKERSAFFIEEPELHMHAGMLRQLMNFYLNETDHFYFFTTHSNHLVDMVDESSDVMIQKFQKRQDPETQESYFQIDQCDRDRDLLAQLGVRPSSVYLSNCTIWVEGITDRLYIHRYMQRYLQYLKDEKSALYAKYQRFMPNYHYSFVEYQGGNLTHWNFDPKTAQDCDNNCGLNADWVCSNALLIADGDIKGKSDRVEVLEGQLGNRFFLLECKEIENTLPTNLIVSVAKDLFDGMQQRTRKDANITGLDSITDAAHFFSENDGIGRLLDQQLNMQPIEVKNKTTGLMESELARCFADKSSTINNKLEFCRKITTLMDSQAWQLTVSAKALCERIFQHIANQNP